MHRQSLSFVHDIVVYVMVMLRSKFKLGRAREPELQELFIGRVGLLGNLLTSSWCFGVQITDNDLDRFASMADPLAITYVVSLR